MNTLISVKNLNKSFPGVHALQDCQFDLKVGEIHALMGENGAGKSTLMKILSGVYQKDSGQILLKGKEVDIASPKQAENLGVRIVHQELNLMSHLSVAQNIYIGHEPMKWGVFLDEARLNRDAQAIFERMNLTQQPTTLVSELTVAKQQMVEIAKALTGQAQVLIMDEPTAALNNVEIEDLFRILRQLRAEGVGIVYISHKMDEIARIADRITVMRDGCYIDTLPGNAPMNTIIQLMVGRTLEKSEKNIPAVDDAEVLLEVKNLRRGKVIKGVNFKIRKGEIIGLAGLMGAGRTEVARAVFGADEIDDGQIYVRGQQVKIRSPADAVRLGIGYLSEDRKQFGLALGMDVSANAALADMKQFLSARFFLNQSKISTIAAQMVEKLRIKTPSIAQITRLLSGGNQQKVVIAKWLIRDCDILFFDEPTRGIDVGAKSEIYKLLNDLAAQGRAIIVISSELPEILRLSHRIIVMCEGRFTGELSGAEASQEDIMQLAVQRSAAVH